LINKSNLFSKQRLSVGIVRDAKINDANVISMMKFKLI